MTPLTIVDYGVGNLGSIANMLKKIGVPAVIVSDPRGVAQATKLILPGVGAFDAGMENLAARGLVDVLNERVLAARVPLLGLCLGMQLLTKSSEEGRREGLGWINAVTRRFAFGPLKVPHMGWNSVELTAPHPLVSELPPDSRFYFVHSYFVECASPAPIVGRTTYGEEFTSIVARDNIMGVQFHPEKSHRFGMALLRGFAQGTFQ